MAIFDVIKWEGDNSTFIWKFPGEDFNTKSQLIVHESQEAIFFLNGQPLDVYGAGRYTLDTPNIPLLRHVINLPTGGVSPFHCEVYFVNKVEQMAIPWGLDSKVQYLEPSFGFPISVGAGGEMSLKVHDGIRLLLKLVGTQPDFTQETLSKYFKAFLLAKVKTYIAQTLKSSKLSIFEMDEHLIEFSDALKERLIPDFLSYGLDLTRFFVTRIVKPDGDPQYENFKELYYRKYADVTDAQIRQKVGVIDQQTEAQKKIIEAQSLAQKRSIEGYTYQQERGFDVAEKLAQNEGSGNFSSAGMGLGMMAGIGGTVGKQVGDIVSGTIGPSMAQQQNARRFCENCGAEIAVGASFCEICGHPVAAPKHIERCKNCGYVFEHPGNFCPKCGAKR